MGNFGKSKKGGTENGNQDDIGELGKKIAKNSTTSTKEYDYFAKNK
jgi:hypothetical protein